MIVIVQCCMTKHNSSVQNRSFRVGCRTLNQTLFTILYLRWLHFHLVIAITRPLAHEDLCPTQELNLLVVRDWPVPESQPSSLSILAVFFSFSVPSFFFLFFWHSNAKIILMTSFKVKTVTIKRKCWFRPRGSNPSPSAYGAERWATTTNFSVILCLMAVCFLLHVPLPEETKSLRWEQGRRKEWMVRSHSITRESMSRPEREASGILQTNIDENRNLKTEGPCP